MQDPEEVGSIPTLLITMIFGENMPQMEQLRVGCSKCGKVTLYYEYDLIEKRSRINFYEKKIAKYITCANFDCGIVIEVERIF